MSNTKTYEYVAERLIKMMESEGKLIWHKDWTDAEAPRNGKSGRVYEGFLNLLMTWGRYKSPCWYTINNLNELGGRIKPEETKNWTLITFWTMLRKKTGKKKVNAEGVEVDEIETIPLLKYFRVWNYEQCTGLPAPKIEAHAHQKVTAVEDLMSKLPEQPNIQYGGSMNKAYYSPSEDKICMPTMESFKTAGGFYSTRFHEITHWTGHTSRLNRLSPTWFGSETYSEEELVAEMGAAFLCAICGISNEELDKNSAAYLQNWLSKLREDKTMLMKAISKSRKAVEYLTNETPSYKKTAAPVSNDVQAIPA
jgi:antirestriction protein ArdC